MSLLGMVFPYFGSDVPGRLFVRVACYQGKGVWWDPRAGVVRVAGVARGL